MDTVARQRLLTKFIPVSFIVILSVLICIFGFSPNIKRLKSLNKQINQLKQDIAGEARLISNVKSMKAETEEVNTRLNKFKERSFANLEISPILRGLTQMAQASSMEFISVKPLPAIEIKKDEKEGYYLSELPIELELKGGYNEALSLLKQIEEEEKTAYRIDRFELTDIPQEIKKHNIKLLLSAFSYVEYGKK